jgi:hypothetical protein
MILHTSTFVILTHAGDAVEHGFRSARDDTTVSLSPAFPHFSVPAKLASWLSGLPIDARAYAKYGVKYERANRHEKGR